MNGIARALTGEEPQLFHSTKCCLVFMPMLMFLQIVEPFSNHHIAPKQSYFLAECLVKDPRSIKSNYNI
ncbi:unnamed protein product [Caenorhabditis nigoni]